MICIFLLVGAHCQNGAERVKDETTLGKSCSWFLSWIWTVKVAQLCPTLCNPMDCPWNSPGQNTGVTHFPYSRGSSQPRDRTQSTPHFRQILYHLSYKGSPRILEWVAYPFSSGSSQPRNQPGSPALQADSLPIELSVRPKPQSSVNFYNCVLKFHSFPNMPNCVVMNFHTGFPQGWTRSESISWVLYLAKVSD